MYTLNNEFYDPNEHAPYAPLKSVVDGVDSLESTHINQFVDAIKSIESRIGDYYRDVITKCQHCGQWAAAKTSCASCGAPVDPPKQETGDWMYANGSRHTNYNYQTHSCS